MACLYFVGLGPRKFRSRAVELGDQSVWTDTPADRARKVLCKHLLKVLAVIDRVDEPVKEAPSDDK